MTGIGRRGALGAAIALAWSAVARAQQAGAIAVTAPWTRVASQGAQGAGYMTLRNGGTAPDRLVAARTPAAQATELHTHVRDGDVMRMRQVPAIDLPPGQPVMLQPGGLHLMLIGLTQPLRQGAKLPVTLVFERAGEVQVELSVESAGARAPAAGGHRH
jgi:copper(I)-binding protein